MTNDEPSALPDVSHLAACQTDCCHAVAATERGPADVRDYDRLRARLEPCRDKLPPLYREAVYDRFVASLDRLGATGFYRTIQSADTAQVLFDIAQVILQNGEGYESRATDAFQEVISDLYDGFLSEEDRRGVKPPDERTAPLAKWGRPSEGPYTMPVDATGVFGVHVPLVNLPPALAHKGLLAWSALGHETGGHDILAADEGLLGELSERVELALDDDQLKEHKDFLQEYWSCRVDESGADTLGILNMGPAAALGMIAFFRGWNMALGEPAKLSDGCDDDDYHPSDLVRGFLAASVIRRLRFGRAKDWAQVIEAETRKDIPKKNAACLTLDGIAIPVDIAARSADIVAGVLVRDKMDCLERHALGQIQNWRDHDEKIASKLRALLTSTAPLPARVPAGAYAAHTVAAAVTAAASGGDVEHVFDRMLALLKAMHDSNPAWGPLYVHTRGSLVPRYVLRQALEL
jgi:hypothetical protein